MHRNAIILGGLFLLSLIICVQLLMGARPSVLEVSQVGGGGEISIPASGEVLDVVVEQARPVEVISDFEVLSDRGVELIETRSEDSSERSIRLLKDGKRRSLSYFGRIDPEPRSLNLDLHLVSASGEEIRVTPEGLFNKTYALNAHTLEGASVPRSIQESFSVWASSEEIENSRSFTLWPAASLDVSIIGIDTIGGDNEDLEIDCELDSGWMPLSWPRVYRYLRDKSTRQQSAQHFQVLNLPPNATIWVSASRRSNPGSGQIGAILRETSVTLEPGENREILFDLTEGTRVRGTFVDEQGHAVLGHEVWILPVTFELGAYLSGYDDPVFSTFTDDYGQFEFAAVESGRWWVGPSPLRKPWHYPDEELFAPVAELVEVEPDSHVTEVELVGYKELYIRGRLIDPDGIPLANRVSIGVSCPQLGVGAGCESDNSGNFSIGPLAPGSYSISSPSIGSLRPPDKVLAEAGSADVLIQYQRGGSLSGAVVNGTTGEKARSTVYLTREGAFEEEIRRCEAMHATEGSFEFRGLENGTYYICAASNDGRLGTGVAELSELAETRDIVIQLQESATIRVFNEIAHTGSFVYAWLGDMHAGKGYMADNRGTSITVLPGQLHVVVYLHGTRYVETVDLKPGETKDVVFSSN